MFWRCLGILALFLMTWSCARAADIEIGTLKDDLRFISISGEFSEGDDLRFKNLAISAEKAVVLLSSQGGLVQVGMEIGRTIAIKGFSTFVGDDVVCASSCGLVWLAGRHRFISPTAKVGFHAVFTTETGQQDVSGVGNALVGSYLQQLGLPPSVVIYATLATPASMQWLTADDAKKIGLDIDLIQPDSSPSASSEPIPFGGSAAASYAPPNADAGPAALPAPIWQVYEYTDLPGYDLPNMPLKLFNVDECKLQCDANSRCRAFTFNQRQNVCFLKGMATEALQFSGAISGYKGDPADVTRTGHDFGPVLSFRTTKEVEILGKPFARANGSSLAACQDQCVLTPSCQGFNFYRNGVCTMMSARKPTRKNLLSSAGARAD